jgi:hypothetical protein
MDAPPPLRLRQAVIVAAELEPAAARLREELGLGEPYADPGVGYFGLRNAVFALGDSFLEIVSPVREGTAAGRYLERRGGDGGYMLMFQVDDLEGARARAAEMAIRTVWQIDLPDIAASHLHPADTRGAILSLDRPVPPESWRWGGPDWTGRAGEGAPGRLEGATVAVTDPAGVAERWERLLAADPLAASVEFTEAASEEAERLVEVALALPAEVRRDRDAVEIAGLRFRLRDL